jgi:1-acyl-sn-glycerol-3-phosphate acyltransferase
MVMTEISEAQSLFSIREFFAGKHVFLTGSTGFLAKAIVEKLLFDLPEVGQVNLLIRPRCKPNGQRVDPVQRLRDEVLSNSAFDRLRERHGNGFEEFCASKIRCVPGDLTQEKLGIEEGEYDRLASRLDVIINSAATVVFDERLDLALTLNALGPGRLLDLARRSGAIYVHISTCYVSGKRQDLVQERLLDPLAAIDAQLPKGAPRPARFDAREEIGQLELLVAKVKEECQRELAEKQVDPDSDAGKARLNNALVEAGMKKAQSFGWYDTYTFTKFLGEQLVHMDHGPVSTVIVRPSIIESGLREPSPGWLDGLRMADPIIIGYGKGRLSDFPANPGIIIDIIPADFVVNAVLASAAHIARYPGGFDLFQVASSSENPLRFKELYDHVRDCFQRHPFLDKAGRPVKVPAWRFPSVKSYRRRMKARYMVPARLASRLLSSGIPIPGANRWRARLRSKISTLEQLLYYVDIYGPYVNLKCRFESSRCLKLFEALELAERELFNFDPRCIDWRVYFQEVHIPGLKRNILRMGAPPRAGAGKGRLLEEEEGGAVQTVRLPGMDSEKGGGNGSTRAAGIGKADSVSGGVMARSREKSGGSSVGESNPRKSHLRAVFDRAPAEMETVARAFENSAARRRLRSCYELVCGCILRGYFRIKCHGVEHVRVGAPFILVSNHCSHLDSAAIRYALGSRADDLYVMAAKDYFFDTRFKSWFFGTFMNALPFNREAHAKDGFVVCRLALENGRAVLIYPEGGRSPDGNLQRFKSGVGVVAIEHNVPVIPVHVSGTHQVWPKNRRFPRPGPVEVRIGEPADLSDLKALRGRISPAELYRRAAAELRDRVQSLCPCPTGNGNRGAGVVNQY